MTKKALILVDLQNDFCEGGSLAAPDANAIIPIANHLQPHFELVIATQDWHPQNHTSFASNHPGHQLGEVIQLKDTQQVLWPDHCVQGSHGAEFHPALETHHIKKTFHKGVDAKIDSYSAFYDNAHKRSTGLTAYLHKQGVEEVYIMGLVTEYCVKYSSIDAIKEGFKVKVVLDGCRAVNLQPNDEENALKEMAAHGIEFVNASDLTNQ